MAPKSKAEIQKDSDARRQVKMVSFKVPLVFIDKLDHLANTTGKSKTKIVIESVEQWEKSALTSAQAAQNNG